MSDKPKVLIIDDEVDLAELLAELLEDEYDCEAISEIEQIHAKLFEPDFDIIVTDQNMPELTGVEILEKLKEKEINKPVIVLTGADDQDPQNIKARELGAVAILTKPIGDPDILSEAIKKALN